MASFTPQHLQAMSEEQLSALLAKLKDDAGLLEKLKRAADLDAAVAIAKDSGFDVNKSDCLTYQASNAELSDEELKDVAGGGPNSNIIDRNNIQNNIIEENILSNIIYTSYNIISICNTQSNIIDNKNC